MHMLIMSEWFKINIHKTDNYTVDKITRKPRQDDNIVSSLHIYSIKTINKFQITELEIKILMQFQKPAGDWLRPWLI